MKDDPIVAEVRKNRDALAQKCGFDLVKLVSEAMSREKTSGHRLVSLPPTRVEGSAMSPSSIR